MRAEEHLKLFERALQTFKGLKPIGVTRYVDTERELWMYSIRGDFPPPPELGIFAGEVLYQLSSALDHIAYAFADRMHTISDEELKRVAFPIFDDDKVYAERSGSGNPTRRSGLYRVGMLSERVQRQIEALQPYHRGDLRHHDPLWVLHELRNYDTHRAVRPVFAGVRYPTNVGAGAWYKRGSLDDGDVFAVIPAALDPEKTFEPHISSQVTMPPIPGIEFQLQTSILREMYEYVRVEVLPAFTSLYVKGS
jgi:hypothetical protein